MGETTRDSFFKFLFETLEKHKLGHVVKDLNNELEGEVKDIFL